MRVLVIDNYDSFVYNLVQYLGQLDVACEVYRNDEITLAEVGQSRPDGILLSPGPGTPSRAGIMPALIKEYGDAIPMLGVCLGHQAIGEAFGGRVVRAERLMHGKTTMVAHRGGELFRGVPSPFEVMRYHSLVVEAGSLPAELEVTAWSDDRTVGSEIMGLGHRDLPIHGVQFHPESVGTHHGKRILVNFLAAAGAQVVSAAP